MFFLSNREGEMIRQHENKMALRRIRRKTKGGDKLIISEGDSFKKSLRALAKAEAKAEAPAKTAKKSKKVKEAKVEATPKVRKAKSAKK